jgi:glucose-6-phosphate 1-dehydrogenase
MPTNEMPPYLFIIFGALGDLARRKLLPALYHLSSKGELGEDYYVVGVDVDEHLHDKGYRSRARKMLAEAGLSVGDEASQWCDSRLYYHCIGQGSPADYEKLASKLEALEKECGLPGNRVLYLALPSDVVPTTVASLGEAGLNRSAGWTRLVLEKPFGWDLASAHKLNGQVHRYFDESQIYRTDHFLGKETVQNLLVFRFANTFFEHLWNREHIKNVQMTVAEDLGVEKRAAYYERAGALRDMVQNHLTQLLALVAMEAPLAFRAGDIRSQKIKVLHRIAAISPADLVFGQYVGGKIDGQDAVGYREEPNVSPKSNTETFAALKIDIPNRRWKGVPFYLRTGKRMALRCTQIVVTFHCAPASIFHPFEETCGIRSNVLVITLQPYEGFDLYFQVKNPGQPFTVSTQPFHFRYSGVFGDLPDAYETIILDIILGDQTLFVCDSEVETAWRLYDGLLKADISVHPYTAGSWGPNQVNLLFDDWQNRGA